MPAPSLAALLQYALLALGAYVFAGAPLREMLFGRAPGVEADARVSREKLGSLVLPQGNLSCDEVGYGGVYVLGREPLVLYVEGFLAEGEADEVVALSNPLFQPSTIWSAGEERLDTSVRHSSKAAVPRSHTVKCIEERARAFQGWRPFVFVEKLWAQRYGPNGHYTYHYDWSNAGRKQGRISSFMVWLGSECTGGGTHFPRLKKPEGKEWCKFIECGDESGEEMEGVVFKPIKGNAVYWENIRPDGTGYEESWHAALPVLSGEKIGLNIWNWYQEGFVPEEASKDGIVLEQGHADGNRDGRQSFSD